MVASTRSVRDVGLRSSMSELLEAWFADRVDELGAHDDPSDPFGVEVLSPSPHRRGGGGESDPRRDRRDVRVAAS